MIWNITETMFLQSTLINERHCYKNTKKWIKIYKQNSKIELESKKNMDKNIISQLNHCWSKRRHINFSKCWTNKHKCKIVKKETTMYP